MPVGQTAGLRLLGSFVGQGQYFDCPVEINGVATPTKGFIDDVTTEYAAGFIRENKDQSFLLILGYKTCHGPFTPPPRHEKTYEGSRRAAHRISEYERLTGPPTPSLPGARPLKATRLPCQRTSTCSAALAVSIGAAHLLYTLVECPTRDWAKRCR